VLIGCGAACQLGCVQAAAARQMTAARNAMRDVGMAHQLF
jgi:hypothetical protein